MYRAYCAADVFHTLRQYVFSIISEFNKKRLRIRVWTCVADRVKGLSYIGTVRFVIAYAGYELICYYDLTQATVGSTRNLGQPKAVYSTSSFKHTVSAIRDNIEVQNASKTETFCLSQCMFIASCLYHILTPFLPFSCVITQHNFFLALIDRDIKQIRTGRHLTAEGACMGCITFSMVVETRIRSLEQHLAYTNRYNGFFRIYIILVKPGFTSPAQGYSFAVVEVQ